MTEMEFIHAIQEESSEDVNYDQMVVAAEKIKSFAEEMARHSSSDIKELNRFGANLSAEYDRLSLASVKAVQQNIDNEASKVLRMSVLELGQQCLQLIKVLGDDQGTSFNGTSARNLKNEVKNVSKKVEIVLKALQLLQDTSHFHNVYWKFIEALENIYNNQESEETWSKIGNVQIQEIMDSIIKDTKSLYIIIKMVLVNLVSPDNEKLASLQLLLQSVKQLHKSIRNLIAIVDTPLVKNELSNSVESLISLIIDLLITCNEAEDSITSQHTRAILKAAVKDVSQNLQGILEIIQQEKENSIIDTEI